MSDPHQMLDYHQSPRTPAMAYVVFWLAIVAAFGFFVIIPSLIVFILAGVVRRNVAAAQSIKGNRLVTAASWISALSMGLGIATIVLYPSRGSMGPAPRSTCAAKLRGITQSMNVYAADNNDHFPLVSPTYSSTLAASLPGTPAPDTILLSSKPDGLYAPATPAGNVVQNFWLLVLTGQVSPRQFICKSDPANVSAAPLTVPGSSNVYANFHAPSSATNADLTYSYSFAFPWTAGGKIGDWWHNDTDAAMPLIADIAPANGTGSPAANTLDGTKKSANSRNHNGDGQNVGFADGHAEFDRLANCGESNDNIFSANGSAGPSPTGITPASATDPKIAGGTKGNWDIILVPAADVMTGTRR